MDRLPKCLAILLLLASSFASMAVGPFNHLPFNPLRWRACPDLAGGKEETPLNIYVSPSGSDANPGNAEHPLATIQSALRKARELRKQNSPSISKGIHIILADGTYSITGPININAADAGTPSSPTIIEAAKGAHPVISGGINVSGWRKLVGRPLGMTPGNADHIWEAELPTVNGKYFLFRQLWVNDRKATRAKSENGNTMNRILGWDKQDQACWIPTPAHFHWAEGVEMFIHQWWEIAILRIKNMEFHGDSTKLFFEQPESKLESEHPWPPPWISKETGNSAFFLTNAISFLDEPGEWWADSSKGRIYYWPRSSEDPTRMNAIVPFSETLVKIKGSIDNPVTNINFKGISFEHTTWLRPSLEGHVPLQEGMYLTKAYKLNPKGTKQNKNLDNQAWIGRPAPAVELWYVEDTKFENCRFEHLASTGLDMRSAVHYSTLQGNVFKDIGGTAVLIGRFSDTATETHIPWDPPDKRLICDGLHISNNLITDAGNEDWGCVGIGAGYIRNTVIEHNELENLPYTGISIGWGWNAIRNGGGWNRIVANRIQHYAKHNYDCAGIYTLSDQGGTIITGNYIDSIYKAPYAHLPFHWFYLYTDEGTSNLILKNNWTPSQKYLQNANGPGNHWEDNGPQVDLSIKSNAGLEPAYRYLQQEKTSNEVHLAINEERPILLEITAKNNTEIDLHKLKTILADNKIDSNSVYEWQNHYAIYSSIPDIGRLHRRIQNSFPTVSVKVYYDLVYEFNKQKNCSNKSISPEWDNILLTANLVDDKKLQQEYLNYHASQFEKWPEVSQGFCNANFQQLLVYKNGRQLVIIISIPKGESLEQLNPKTTENNPRMVEWNNMMSKYQEGIEGTKKGETWVFFNRLN